MEEYIIITIEGQWVVERTYCFRTLDTGGDTNMSSEVSPPSEQQILAVESVVNSVQAPVAETTITKTEAFKTTSTTGDLTPAAAAAAQPAANLPEVRFAVNSLMVLLRLQVNLLRKGFRRSKIYVSALLRVCNTVVRTASSFLNVFFDLRRREKDSVDERQLFLMNISVKMSPIRIRERKIFCYMLSYV